MNQGIVIQGRRYGTVLWMLWTLFGFRVLGQLLQYLHPVSFLPPFEDWQGSALPYRVLLSVQGVILLVLARIASGVSSGAVRPRLSLGYCLHGFAGLYLLIMTTRLALGLSVLAGHPWFDKPVPTLFHFVLATYLLVLARYHGSAGEAARR